MSRLFTEKSESGVAAEKSKDLEIGNLNFLMAASDVSRKLAASFSRDMQLGTNSSLCCYIRTVYITAFGVFEFALPGPDQISLL